MTEPGSLRLLPRLPRNNLPPPNRRRGDEGDPGSSHKNLQGSHLPKDQEEGLKGAKTRVRLKQLRRKQKPLEKNDQEAGPGNGHSKWSRRSQLRNSLKRHPHRNQQKMIRKPHLAISTSSAVGSFEGRRHCHDHCFCFHNLSTLAWVGRKEGIHITLKRTY